MASALPDAGALATLGPEACAALRARLAAAGFDEVLLSEAERVAPRQLDAVRLPLVHAWLGRRGGASSALAALLCYGAEVSTAEAGAALGEELVAGLRAAGALAPTPGGLLARYRLTPLGGLLLLSDPPDAGPETAMGPGPTTLLLARLLPESPGEVLDVGCGAGTLALLAAARGARRAVGVDLSPRAITLARFNARLNCSPAEFHAGDLLEPVRGERFDLAVSQPPYVVLPPGMAATTYLHGGPLGEELALRFAAALPEALKEGGLGLLHFDSPVLPVRSLVARLRQALGQAPVDLAVLAAPGPSPDLQAAAYSALEDPALGPRYRETVPRYREHLARSGVESFTRALAILRRSAVAGGAFTVQLPVPALDRLGAEDVPRFLRGLDLAGAPEPVVLAARVGVAPGARLVEELPLGPDAPAARLALRFDRGVASDHELGEPVRALVEALLESGSVSEAVDRYARACAAERGAVLGRVLEAVRDGLARAWLVAG